MVTAALSLDELVGQCVIFFLAGYDTTASTLSYASYLLALNPGIQNTLYEELREVLQRHKGELTYEALQDMKYLDNVISETLRLYSPSISFPNYTKNFMIYIIVSLYFSERRKGLVEYLKYRFEGDFSSAETLVIQNIVGTERNI
ncbi:cytochrome P450 9e2 [Nephila pilipes]|uniref:Cytochrome P450 9e2 n=1 Tax=Nephila pilipes TaxID=299642 RepID=A0A8X6TUD5_NEPPI|nr:cytochrome P450 9e2 [Nephila pilipes]